MPFAEELFKLADVEQGRTGQDRDEGADRAGWRRSSTKGCLNYGAGRALGFVFRSLRKRPAPGYPDWTVWTWHGPWPGQGLGRFPLKSFLAPRVLSQILVHTIMRDCTKSVLQQIANTFCLLEGMLSMPEAKQTSGGGGTGI